MFELYIFFSQNELATSGGQDETFGEDIYEPILVNQEEQRTGPPAEK